MPTTATMSLADERAAIEALLTEFYWRLDHAGGASVAELFVESSELVTPQGALAGRRQIDDWFQARASGARRITRHSWTNARLTWKAADHVTVEAHVMTIATLQDAPAGALEVTIGDTTDVVAKDAVQGWRFVSRRLDLVAHGRVANS